MTILIIALYNLTLIAGTAYLVALHDWSPWWFALTVLLLANYKKDKKNERDIPKHKFKIMALVYRFYLLILPTNIEEKVLRKLNIKIYNFKSIFLDKISSRLHLS